jgi:putative transposase
MRKVEFAENEIYHLYNRGVDKRDIFLDDKDYYRFIHSLYEFNDEQPALHMRFLHAAKSKVKNHSNSSILLYKNKRLPLVEICAFTLMPNHYHLMIRQIKPDGVTRFMQKLGTGYTMYFNKKYERSGALFQGRFKAVHVTKQEQLVHVSHYIHTNPLKMFRGSTSNNPIDFLLSYRWSSFLDYVGKNNFPSVINRQFLLDVFSGESNILDYTIEHLEVEPRRF